MSGIPEEQKPCTPFVGAASYAGVETAQAEIAGAIPPSREDGGVTIFKCARCITRFSVSEDGPECALRLESESMEACVDPKTANEPGKKELRRGDIVTGLDLGENRRKVQVLSNGALLGVGWD